MRYINALAPILLLSVLLSCSVNALAYDDPYAYQPLYGSPDSNGLSRSPSRDLYGNEVWDSPPRQNSPYNDYSQPRRNEPAGSPTTSPVPHDFNVIGRDGRPQLCTSTKDTVYCY
jgi:hypothetical protein